MVSDSILRGSAITRRSSPGFIISYGARAVSFYSGRFNKVPIDARYFACSFAPAFYESLAGGNDRGAGAFDNRAFRIEMFYEMRAVKTRGAVEVSGGMLLIVLLISKS